MIAEVKEGGGEAKLGWVKAHMSTLRPLTWWQKIPRRECLWMITRSGCRGGIRQWARQRKRKYVEGGIEEGFVCT